MQKLLMVLIFTSLSFSAMANAKTDSISFNYKDTVLIKVIEDYSKASGQKFIVDPSARGTVNVFNKEPLSIEEAFNQLSQVLAIQSLSIVKVGDIYKVTPARNAQRDNIEVFSELPPIQPTRMVTWVIPLKHADAQEVMKNLRVLPSKDGEMVMSPQGNQIIISDWTTNLHRVGKILEKIDVPKKKK